VKKDLYRPPPTIWRADPKYQKVRMNIRDLRGSQTERSDENEIKRGAFTDQSAGLSHFATVEELLLEPRPFGEERTSLKPETAVKFIRRQSTMEEMRIFWRSEIDKYNEVRSSRLIASTPRPKIQENRGTNSAAVQFGRDGDEGCSSLQRFVMNYGQFKLLHPKQFQENQRMKREAKMGLIKPSPDVLKLSEKYLPKHFKRFKIAKKQQKVKKFAGFLRLPEPSKAPYSAFWYDTPEEEILKDAQRERQDQDHIFHKEKILNKLEVKRGKDRRNVRLLA
jgi:hypothetical protein